MQQVTRNVYVECHIRGCNPGFVTTSEGVVMIDTPQQPSEAVKWRDLVAAKGTVRYLINTEPHGDHITGNAFFPTATVIAHQGTKERFAIPPVEQMKERMRQTDPDSVPLVEDYKPHPPTITFTDRLTLDMGDHTFQLIHLPGHTASEIAVYIPEERLTFTGDNIFYKVQVFLQEANPFDWLESLKKIAELDVDILVPGHGEVCDKSYIPEMASFIQEWVDAVRDAVEQGMSKEEAMDRISFLDRYPMGQGLEAMGPGLQRMNVSNLYDRLSKH